MSQFAAGAVVPLAYNAILYKIYKDQGKVAVLDFQKSAMQISLVLCALVLLTYFSTGLVGPGSFSRFIVAVIVGSASIAAAMSTTVSYAAWSYYLG